MENFVALSTYDELDLMWDQERLFLNSRDRWISYSANFFAKVASLPNDTVPEEEESFSHTLFDGLDKTVDAFTNQSLQQVWIEFVLEGLSEWATLPLKNELETIEIYVGLSEEEFDLSLLDKREREFFEDFVGSFDPGADFTKEDLIVGEVF